VASFGERVKAAYQQAGSALVIGLAPRLDQMPQPIQQYDDPFLPYGRAVIEATRDVVFGYVFHLGAYLALGAAGVIALERTIAMVPTQNIKILHAPFVTVDYIRASYEDALNADAVTLATVDRDVIAAYVAQPSHGVFVHVSSEIALSSDLPMEQVGSYRAVGEAHNTLTIAGMVLYWQWSKPILAARGHDFREVIRTEAIKAKERLIPS
jgi:hypothetical protein